MSVGRRRRRHRTRHLKNRWAALCFMQIGQTVRKWQLPTALPSAPSVHQSVHPVVRAALLRRHVLQLVWTQQAWRELLLAEPLVRDTSHLWMAGGHADRPYWCRIMVRGQMLTAYDARWMRAQKGSICRARMRLPMHACACMCAYTTHVHLQGAWDRL